MTSVLEAPVRATARQAPRPKEDTGERLPAGSALGLGTAVLWMSLVVLLPLTAVVAKVITLSGAAYFWFFAGLMLAAALAFRAVARRYPAPPVAAASAAATGPA